MIYQVEAGSAKRGRRVNLVRDGNVVGQLWVADSESQVADQLVEDGKLDLPDGKASLKAA